MKVNAKRSIFALSLLLVLLLSMAMVSASDINADDNSSSVLSDTSDLSLEASNGLESDVSSESGVKENLNQASSKLGDSALNEDTDEALETEIEAFYSEDCVGDSAFIELNLQSNGTFLSDEIEVFLNNQLFTKVVTNEDYDVDVTLTGLNIGPNDIILLYEGKDGYAPTLNSFVINSYEKGTTIDFSLNEKVIVGEDVKISDILLKDYDGNVIFGNISIEVYDSNNNTIPCSPSLIYIMGSTTIANTSLKPYEDYEVYLRYGGMNYSHAPYTAYSYFTVLETLDTVLSIDHESYSIGNSTTIYVELLDENYNNLNDTVDIYLNDEFYASTYVGEYQNTVNIEGLELGFNKISVVYNGTKFYNASENEFNITRYDLATYLNIECPNVVIGKDAVITVNLTDFDDNIIDDEFTVIVRENYARDNESYVPLEETYNFTGNGTITIEAIKLNEGSQYNVYASYPGNLTNAPVSEVESFNVVSRDTDIMVFAPFSAEYEEIILELELYNMAGEILAGNVELAIYDNESNLLSNQTVTTVSQNSTKVNIGEFTAGHYLIVTKFNGNHFYNECQENFSLHVFKSSELSIEAHDVTIGDDETINFTLSTSDGAILNGTIFVEVHDLKKQYDFADYLNLTDGKASLEIKNITGDLIIYAFYDSKIDDYGPYSTDYLSAIQYGTIRVLENANATLDLENGGDSIIASLKYLDGNPIANATLTADVNGVKTNLTTDEKGQASIPITDNATVELSYTDENGLTVSSKIIVMAKEVTKQRAATQIVCSNMKTTAVAKPDGRIGKYFNVVLRDASGKALANKLVKIGFNGVEYNRTTNSTGGVRLQINLGYAGLYTFAICFLGDDDYNASFKVALINVTRHTPKLTAKATTYKATAKTKTLSATFKTSNGNAISGKTLVFIFNGKVYNAKTNAKGVAKINVAISKKGTYACTVRSTEDGMYAATSTKFNVKIT